MQLRVCVLVLSGFCLLSLSKAREDVTEHSMAAGIFLEACGCLETSCWVRKQGKGSPVLSWLSFPHGPFVSPQSCSVSPFWKWWVLGMELGPSRAATSGLNCWAISAAQRRKLFWRWLRKTLIYEYNRMSRVVILWLRSFSRTKMFVFP